MALHGSAERGILAQRQVRAKQVAQMALVEDDQVIQAISSDRSDQALDVGVLPRRTRCRWSIPDPHSVQPPLEDLAKGAITISDKMARRPDGLPQRESDVLSEAAKAYVARTSQ
jgi:hypothetical protein